MRIRTLFAVIVALLAAAFVVLNWGVLAAPARINLLLTAIDTPVGVVMLVLFGLLLAGLSAFIGVWQTTLLQEFRRQARELQLQRTLAENAETSRFTELGALIREEFDKSGKRVETALEALRTEVRDTENSIAATLGEMDDRHRRDSDTPMR